MSSIFISGAKAQWTLSETNIYNNNTANTKVGIGTTTPGAKLEVQIGTALGSNTGSSLLLKRISSTNATNYFMNNLWLSRDAGGSSWLTTRLHDAISIDGSYLTPGTNTRTWWERDPLDDIQAWGTGNTAYMSLKREQLAIGEIFLPYDGTMLYVDNYNTNSGGNFTTTARFENNRISASKYGVYAIARGNGGLPTITAGVRGIGVGVCSNNQTVGVYGEAFNSYAAYGVLGVTTYEGCNPQGFSAAVFAQGDLIYTGNFSQGSDIKLKENIKEIDLPLELILKLKPKSYNFKYDASNYKHINLSKKKSYGLIAQDVEKLLPELISNAVCLPKIKNDSIFVGEKVEFKTLNYLELIPILIAAFQEEHQANLKKDSLIQNLSERIAKLEKTPQNKTAPQQGNLEIFPNPFKNQATIRYRLPENTESGYLIIRNEKGEIFKEIRLNKGDSREISIETANQAKGLYFCTLIADGEKILSKRMILEK